jgi:tetratricopeptide (TPR) repeat protein
MKKIFVTATIIGMVVLFMSTLVFANDKMTGKKAEGYVNAGMFSQAVSAYNDLILDEPENINYHFQLVVLYAKYGDVNNAKMRIESVARLTSKKGKEIGAVCKRAADDLSNAGGDNNIDKASQFFELASDQDPSLKNEACSFYIRIGDNSPNVSRAECYYEKALNNCGDVATRKKIGGRYLKLAAMNKDRKEPLVQKAKALGVEEAFIKKVLPDSYEKVVFETKKPLTINDAYDKERGRISVFSAEQYPPKKNDVIEVTAKVIGENGFSGKEICIYRGDNFTPQWADTVQGIWKKVFELDVNSGEFIISLDGRKDVEVTVKATRKVTPEPNTNLLASL